jgi:hypothetical protein
VRGLWRHRATLLPRLVVRKRRLLQPKRHDLRRLGQRLPSGRNVRPGRLSERDMRARGPARLRFGGLHRALHHPRQHRPLRFVRRQRPALLRGGGRGLLRCGLQLLEQFVRAVRRHWSGLLPGQPVRLRNLQQRNLLVGLAQGPTASVGAATVSRHRPWSNLSGWPTGGRPGSAFQSAGQPASRSLNQS